MECFSLFFSLDLLKLRNDNVNIGVLCMRNNAALPKVSMHRSLGMKFFLMLMLIMHNHHPSFIVILPFLRPVPFFAHADPADYDLRGTLYARLYVVVRSA